jgi:cardiolipin-specific phospholipase
LIGHSFGGYISGHYALKYPDRIHKLLLMSPIGIRVAPEGEDGWKRFMTKSESVKKNGGSPPSALTNILVKTMWNSKTSPISIAKILGLK